MTDVGLLLALPPLVRLLELGLDGLDISDRGMAALMTLTSLRTLSLARCSNVRDAGAPSPPPRSAQHTCVNAQKDMYMTESLNDRNNTFCE